MIKVRSICFFFVTCILACHSQQNDDWVPRYGAVKLQFADERIFRGSEGGRPFPLASISDIKVDAQENLFLAADKQEGILEFSSNSAFLGEIGRRGQGPGEFQKPDRLFISADGNLYVFDSQLRVIDKFDTQGKFKASIFLRDAPVPFCDFYIDSLDEAFLFAYDFAERSSHKSLIKVDARGETIDNIVRYLEERLDLGPEVMGGVVHSYTPRIFLCSYGAVVYFGCSLDNKIFKLQKGSRKAVVAEIGEKPIPISSAEKNYFSRAFKDYLSQLRLPPMRPFYINLLCDEKERIYLIRTKSILEKDKSVSIDIFDKKGTYLYRAQSEFEPKLIRNGKFYVIENNESGENYVRRLKIKGYAGWKY